MKTAMPIHVLVDPFFLEEQSLPDDHHYVWALEIWVENQGDQPVQLMGRHWRMTDGRGLFHEVRGQGVVGEKPWIAPGSTFHYTTGTSLSTPSGLMDGTYHMVTEKGESFEVLIPAFSLDSPFETASVH